MIDGEFSVDHGCGSYPIFVRKLNKKSIWGDPSDNLEKRASTAASDLFPEGEEQYSFYRVESDSEFAVVVVALNEYRHRSGQKIDFVGFKHDEFDQANATLIDALGETECKHANSLHVDMQIEPNSKETLCRTAMSSQRLAFRIPTRAAKKLANQMELQGCESFPQNNNCPCIS